MSGASALAGSIALVTGASSGLGCHFATVLARAGASVALAARRIEPLEDLARSIEAGFSLHFTKPIQIRDLEKVLAHVAGHRDVWLTTSDDIAAHYIDKANTIQATPSRS